MSSKFSASESYHDVDHTVSKSLTDLADLPLPVPTQQKKQAVMQWNDDGFDDFNIEDEVEKSSPKKE